jgi:hypothetical protein
VLAPGNLSSQGVASAGTLVRHLGAIAQLEEHLLCKQGVRGSSPLSSTQRSGLDWVPQRVAGSQKYCAPVMSRGGSGDDAIYLDHSGECRDARLHKGCPGRRRGAASLGYGPDGKRIRRKVSGQTKQDVKDKLGKLHSDLEAGVRAPVARYTVGQAVEDWLREGLDEHSAKTVALYRQVLQFVVDRIGNVALRDLTAQDVRRVLMEAARARSSRTVGLCTTRWSVRSGTRRPTTTSDVMWRCW